MKKIIICVLVTILLIGSLFFIFNRKEYKKAIGKTYEIPLINYISTGEQEIIINAGNYVYGDVNQDGNINKLDILAIEFIIKGDLKYTESQKRLGDLNQDNNVDTKDKDILNDYLDNNSEYSYTYDNDLSYCLTREDDSNTCNWQEDKYIKDIDFSLEDYYIFVKNNKTGNIGSYKSSFSVN